MSVSAGPDGVHGAWLQIHQHCPGHVDAVGALVEVHVHPLQLQVTAALEAPLCIQPVLVADESPELKQQYTIVAHSHPINSML